MKAKKWLTIITLFVSIVSFIIACLIGKGNDFIGYDIAMALLGSAVLGFIMSITEYYVERRKAMEDFWIQAVKILKEYGAKSVDVCCVHPILVNGATMRIYSAGANSVISTNSLSADSSRVSLAKSIANVLRD